jgi:hypothetical protein
MTRLPNPAEIALAAALAIILPAIPGCSAPSGDITWVEPVRRAEGTFVWTRSAGTTRGDAEMLIDRAGNNRIAISQGNGIALAEFATSSSGVFNATGPLCGGGWRGSAGDAPDRHRLWSALGTTMPMASRLPDGPHQLRGPTYLAAVQRKAGSLRRVTVALPDQSESIRLDLEQPTP